MAVQGFWAVLYYGILASFTGGYLPVRAKNLWLVVFHLYLFLTFIVFPLAVYLVSSPGWVWGISGYCGSLVPRPLPPQMKGKWEGPWYEDTSVFHYLIKLRWVHVRYWGKHLG